MPDPVRAWAAVAPDGRIDVESIRTTPEKTQIFVDRLFLHTNRPMWRVVPVKIVPMEGDGGE